MASAAGGRGALGWAMVAAALAVPAFVSYNWWARQKAEHDRGVTAKARARVPEGGVFQTPLPSEGRLVNPISSSATAMAMATGPAAAPAAPAVPVVVVAPARTPVSAAVPVPPPADPVPSIVKTASAAAPAPVAAEADSAPAALAPVSAAVATSTAGAASLPRDPMMSPLDLERLRAAEAEKARAEQAARDAANVLNHPVKPPRRREVKIEDRVELQGIVAKSDGHNLAIVNGSMLNVGESFRVSGADGKVKVVGITTVGVSFEYKNRRFTKNVSRSIGP